MSFNAIITSLPTNARRFVLKSFVGTLNMSIIGYLQQHFRQKDEEANMLASQPADPRDRRDAVPTNDQHNEEIENARGDAADDRFREDTGLAAVVRPMDVATPLIMLRETLAQELARTARPLAPNLFRLGTQLADLADKPNPRDLALPLEETMKFRISQAPRVNERALHDLAEAIKRPVEMLRKAHLEIFNAEREQMLKYRDRVLGAYERIATDAGELGFDTCDEHLGLLPPHVQYKLMCSLVEKLHKADGMEMQAMLRFNRPDAKGDMAFIQAAINQATQFIVLMEQHYGTELAEYIERGGQLKTLEELAKARELEQAEG